MSLLANYVDDVFTGNRKYSLTKNADGTYSMVDVTDYDTEGSSVNAAAMNGIVTEINAKAIKSTSTDRILNAAASTVVTVPGMAATGVNYVVGRSAGATDAQIDAWNVANYMIVPESEVLTFTAQGIVPTIAIPVTILIVG